MMGLRGKVYLEPVHGKPAVTFFDPVEIKDVKRKLEAFKVFCTDIDMRVEGYFHDVIGSSHYIDYRVTRLGKTYVYFDLHGKEVKAHQDGIKCLTITGRNKRPVDYLLEEAEHEND